MSSNVEMRSRVPCDRIEATNGMACRTPVATLLRKARSARVIPATAVPPLRFRGFDGEWGNKNIGEIVSFSKGKGYSKTDICDSGVPLLLYGRMYTNYEAEVSAVDTYCEPVACSVYSSGKEVVCPASGETAEDIARASAVVSRGIVLGGDLNILTPNDDADIDSLFLALSMSNGNTARNVAARAQGKTVVHVHNSDYDEIPLSLPTIPEQRKIGASFRQIDALIAAREKALGKLTNLKKAMLEKMFPRAGAKVPEVRFKGFEGEWRSYDFEDAFERVNAKKCQIQSAEYRQLGAYPVVDQGKDFIVAYSNDASRVFEASKSPVVIFGDHTREIKFVDFDFVVGADGTQLLRPPEQDVLFSYYVLKQVSLPNMGYSRHFKFLLEIQYMFPTIAEQRKICAYFRSLDSLIAARREEVGKLKDLKKALLDRMFV